MQTTKGRKKPPTLTPHKEGSGVKIRSNTSMSKLTKLGIGDTDFRTETVRTVPFGCQPFCILMIERDSGKTCHFLMVNEVNEVSHKSPGRNRAPGGSII